MHDSLSQRESLVSVLLPVYNCECFVSLAIESILNQTYRNVELIIIDDGSTDNTLNVINQYLFDSRLTVISRENKGLVNSLNEAVSIANGEFIARMDADDISSLDRIEKQVNFLKANPDVAIVGSRIMIINEKGDEIGKCYRPLSYSSIRNYFYFGTPLAHPTIMYNMNILSKGEIKYQKNDYPAEDLGLFLRISRRYKIRNVKQRLLKYRITNASISISNRNSQIKKSKLLRIEHFRNEKEKVNFVLSIESDSAFFAYAFSLTKSFIILVLSRANEVEVFHLVNIYIRAIRRKIIKD